MGQMNSKNRSEDTPSVSRSHNDTIVTDSSSSNTLTDPTSSPSISTPKRSRRSMAHKSILDLVKRRSSQSASNAVDTAEGNSRRSWRNSRRWRKTRRDSTDPAESFQNARLRDASSHPISEKLDEVEQPADTQPSELLQTATDQPSTSSPAMLGTGLSSSDIPSAQEVTQSVRLEQGGQTTQEQRLGSAASLAHRLGLHTDDVTTSPSSDIPLAESQNESVVAPATVVTEPLPQQPQPEPSEALADPAQQPAARQFPSPGTLVVVQGVVHTTDVPRPPSNATSPPGVSTPAITTTPLSPLRPRSLSTPRPTTPMNNERLGGARNRLSSFLRPRPSSMLGPRPPSVTGENPNYSMLTAVSSTSNLESTPTNETPSQPTNASGDTPNDSTPEYEATASAPNGARPSGPISSSSIDVLGTLLSVAAAATAASLLTGSSEPILASSLSPPPANLNPNSDSLLPQSPSRPASPTPTAGLGGIPNTSAIGRGERMRQAWGSIRERLGLRPPPAPPSLAEAAGTISDAAARAANVNRTRPDGTFMDARELMLAEMARAFNLGLGLTGEPNGPPAPGEAGTSEHASAPQQTGDSPATQGSAASQLPPDGSFERFLVDLQADLRVALTQDPAMFVEDDSTNNVDATTDETIIESSTPAAAADMESSVTEELSIPSVEPAAAQLTVAEGAQPSSPADSPDDDGDNSLPELEPISDSESESEDENENEHDDDEAGTVTTESDMPGLIPLARRDIDTSASGQAPRPGAQSDTWPLSPPARNTNGAAGLPLGSENSPGRINWWRLYRFPGIAAPRTQNPAETLGIQRPPFAPLTSNSSTPNPVSNLPNLPDSTSASPSPADSPLSNLSSSTPDPPLSTSGPQPTPADPTRPNIVIPVIVVGLQSVNFGWRGDQGIPGVPGETDDIFGPHETDPEANRGEDPDLDGRAHQPDSDNTGLDGNGRPGTPRGRRWHSRAADAIRNLRPGRRVGPRGAQATDGAGSRTFLIYVIGGYYPPDHGIVTGGPNSLDSVEALVELAELLGQVKPPTASREEIEKSGLEIVKLAQLAPYEKDGKIASNCIERCLVCLDDYEPEEDIRLLACEHAFHKNCVDKWLQTGRNNCPACRSRGVPTDASPAYIPVM